MEKIAVKLREKAQQALASGEADRIMGWKKGEFWYDSFPALIECAAQAEELVWDSFCVANLSKYLIKECKKPGKIGVFLKGCDTRAFNQLLKDNRVDRDKVIIYGLPCPGMVDPEKVKQAKLNRGLKEFKQVDDRLILVTKTEEKTVAATKFKYDKCQNCSHPNPVIYDEIMGELVEPAESIDSFARVRAIEALKPEEKYQYWTDQFSKCIRCYACRNVCPACSCEQCTFDNCDSGVAGKAAIDSEDQFYHIIRAYHVAGRCVDCGECSRVCPVGIPLHELNRKIIKDINECYGRYEAGVDAEVADPLATYQLDDIDPFEGRSKGAKK